MLFLYPDAWPAWSRTSLQKKYLIAVLWNRNYFLRFRFRFLLLKSYGSGSDF